MIQCIGQDVKLNRWQTGTHSKVVKFDHFEIRVVDKFPCAKKLNGVSIPDPFSSFIHTKAGLAINRAGLMMRPAFERQTRLELATLSLGS